MSDMGMRYLHRRSNTAPDSGNHAQSIGLRMGYWPCHKGPFVSVEFLTHRWDIWYGTPSTEKED